MSPVNKPKNNSPYAKLIRKSKEEKKKASWIKVSATCLYIGHDVLTVYLINFCSLSYLEFGTTIQTLKLQDSR
jgi:hypothetical protein